MDVGDKSWMYLPKSTIQFQNGVKDFLNKAFKQASQGIKILCPCRLCFNRYCHYQDVWRITCMFMDLLLITLNGFSMEKGFRQQIFNIQVVFKI